jgi:hypothetical protein
MDNMLLKEFGICGGNRMSKHVTQRVGMPMPIAGALFVGLASALLVGFSFTVIQYWPLPASVVPALTFADGFTWGGVAGSITGFVLGFLADERHFEESDQ